MKKRDQPESSDLRAVSCLLCNELSKENPLLKSPVGPENGMRWHPSSKEAEFCRLTLSRPMLFCD